MCRDDAARRDCHAQDADHEPRPGAVVVLGKGKDEGEGLLLPPTGRAGKGPHAGPHARVRARISCGKRCQCKACAAGVFALRGAVVPCGAHFSEFHRVFGECACFVRTHDIDAGETLDGEELVDKAGAPAKSYNARRERDLSS